MEVSSRKRRVFFLPLMFIGMGIGFFFVLEYPTALIACMFVGMGVGFLLDSLFIVEERKVKVDKLYKSSSLVLSFIGLLFILMGILLLISPKLLEELKTYVTGFGFIIFGLFLFIRGIERL